MVSHRRTKRLPHARCVRGVCTLTSGAAAVGAVAAWAPPGAEALDVASAAAQVRALRAQEEAATEQYDAATVEFARLQQRIDGIQAQASSLRSRIDAVSGSLGRLAAAQYRGGGGVDPAWELVFSQQPDQYLRRATTLDALGRGEGVVLRSVSGDQQQLAAFRAEAGAAMQEQEQAEQRAAAARGRILAEYRRAQDLLARLTSAERQALESGGITAGQIAALPRADGRAAAAIGFAESKLGLWYEYGGTGDPSYDCSGLVQAAWAAGGVSLPRVSWDQLSAGQPVEPALAAMRPGDLIFYLGGEHVAMYVGNGLVIHAPSTGQRIQYGAWDMMPITAVRRVLPS